MQPNKLLHERIRTLRAANGNALLQALKDNEGNSEAELQRAWVRNINLIPSLSDTGWYAPPPDGCSVLIGNPPDFERARYLSLRHAEKFPRSDICLSEESFFYAFSSPVSEDYLLGDYGIVLSQSKSEEVRSTIRDLLSLVIRSALQAEVGMEFRELYQLTIDICGREGYKNDVFSITDPRSSNVGHTLPWSYEEPTKEELLVLKNGSPEARREVISKKRVFLNDDSKLKITSPMAITVEPRLTKGRLPPFGFHLTVVFENDKRYLIGGFNPVFEYLGMDQWLNPDDLRVLDSV
jgi:hypothetical protein